MIITVNAEALERFAKRRKVPRHKHTLSRKTTTAQLQALFISKAEQNETTVFSENGNTEL